jgi:hypothetical protein
LIYLVQENEYFQIIFREKMDENEATETCFSNPGLFAAEKPVPSLAFYIWDPLAVPPPDVRPLLLD